MNERYTYKDYTKYLNKKAAKAVSPFGSGIAPRSQRAAYEPKHR